MASNYAGPLSIQILTNLDCNLACSYCYEKKGRGANNIDDMKAFVRARYAESGIGGTDRDVAIDLVGGETLMYPEMLDELLTDAAAAHKEYGCRGAQTAGISTNGTLIAESGRVRDFLLKWRPSLGFSIDGTKEIHDACRKDATGGPSYDRAVAGLKWALENLCPKRIGVKATYCHKTIGGWGEGVINLIELGFRDIAANVIFEEVWTEEDALGIAAQMFKVVDYMFERGIEEKVNIMQINPGGLDMRHFTPGAARSEESNFCGSCVHMRCLGYDGLVYGCNRFCTMENPIPIGRLENGKIVINRPDFVAEVARQYERWPDECRACAYRRECPSCAAIPYEQDGPEAFYSRKPQCGFTLAMTAARLYFKSKLLIKDAMNGAALG